MRDLAPSNEGKRRGLYLEVCVIDAFKDECWRSGLYSHHREHEKGVERNQEGKKKQLTPQREKYINHENTYFWFNHLINQWFGSPHRVISTQTGQTIQPFESSLILSRALKKLCIQWSFSNPMKFTGTSKHKGPRRVPTAALEQGLLA